MITASPVAATVRRRFAVLATTAVVLIALILGIGATSPASAAVPAVAISTSVTVPAASVRPTSVTIQATTATSMRARSGAFTTINPYGCAGLVGAATKLYVASFVLGYCTSVYVLQGTGWGRAYVNYIVNGACRVPWIVRAATNGRLSRCY